MTAEERAVLPPVRWRLVWRNPANGRDALYIASHAGAIEGMDPGESRALLARLMEEATDDFTPISITGELATSFCGTTAPLCIAGVHGLRFRRG